MWLFVWGVFKVIDYGLVPLTKDLLDGLDPFERRGVLSGYHAWLVRARKGDKREAKCRDMRVLNFKQRRLWGVYKVLVGVGMGYVVFSGYQLKDGGLGECWSFIQY